LANVKGDKHDKAKREVSINIYVFISRSPFL